MDALLKYHKLYKLTTTELQKNIVFGISLVTLTTLLEMLGIGLLFPLLSGFDKEVISIPIISVSIQKFDYIYFLLFVYIFRYIFILSSNKYISQLIYRLKYEFASRLFSSYVSLDYQDKIKKDDAEIIRNLTNEINQLVNNIVIPLMILFSELILVFSLASIFLYLYPLIAVYIALALSIPIIVFKFFIKDRISEWGKIRMLCDHRIIKKISEGLNGFVDLKIYNIQSFFINDYQQNLKNSTETEAKQYFLSQVPRISLDTLFVLVILLSIIFSDYFNLGDDAGSIFGLLVVIGIRVLPSIGRLAHCVQALKYGGHVLDIFLEISTKVTKQCDSFTEWKIINLVNVTKTVEDRLILDKQSFEIKRGDKILITGPSGSGKSTLMNLLCGLLPSSGGSIDVDGKRINGENAGWFEEISFVKQQSYIIDASLIDNISIVSETFNKKLLYQIIDLLELNDLLLHSTLGENGLNISGGQRQRVSIARALYKDSSIIFLDEPTSALNAELADKIMNSLLCNVNKTIVCISHTQKWSKLFDKNIVLK
jgi:ATP-binding cassette, subfamily B, bacterial PglK